MLNNYNNAPVDFHRAKKDMERFVMNHVEETENEQDSVMEYDIQDLCRERCPSTTNIGIRLFVGMLFQALISLGVQFTFRREGQRSRFSRIKLNVNGNYSFEAGNNHQRNYSSIAEFMNDEFEPHKGESPRQAHNVTKDWLDDYVTHDAEKKVSFSRLRKLYESVMPDGNETPFSDFLDCFLAANNGLSRTKETGSDGRTKRFISGLRLNKKGKRLING